MHERASRGREARESVKGRCRASASSRVEPHAGSAPHGEGLKGGGWMAASRVGVGCAPQGRVLGPARKCFDTQKKSLIDHTINFCLTTSEI